MNSELPEIPPDVDADAQLEKELAKSSGLSTRMLLIETLADRYLWVRWQNYLDRLRLQMPGLPADHQHFAMAYLAALGGH